MLGCSQTLSLQAKRFSLASSVSKLFGTFHEGKIRQKTFIAVILHKVIAGFSPPSTVKIVWVSKGLFLSL